MRDDVLDSRAGYDAAAQRFRELGIPFWLAVTLLGHGDRLVGQGRPSEAETLLAEAGEIFERLEATPWLERTAGLSSAGREPVTAGS